LAKTSNIEKLTVNYFLINLEVLFSRNPFLSNDSGDFGYVKPNSQVVIDVESKGEITEVPIEIPNDLSKKNLFIEVCS